MDKVLALGARDCGFKSRPGDAGSNPVAATPFCRTLQGSRTFHLARARHLAHSYTVHGSCTRVRGHTPWQAILVHDGMNQSNIDSIKDRLAINAKASSIKELPFL